MGSWKFSEDFKEAMVRKVLNRGDQTIKEFCREEGVALSSITTWIRKHAIASGMTKSKSSGKRSAEEKLKILIQSNGGHGLSEEELGAFLRKEGLHSHEIDEWRQDILRALDLRPGKFGGAKDGSAQRIRELERDLHRKDKALAEASALLILQKKVNLIWGKESEGEK